MSAEDVILSTEQNRPLTDAERDLARWMLQHGTEEAKQYMDQLELAEVTPWRCRCGCASINFQIKGHAEAPPGAHILGEFLVNESDHKSGVFIYSSCGLLRGIEVYGLTGDAPPLLPRPEILSVFEVDSP
ncbi:MULTISPECIES: hypothetical protein [unclassified Bradyrhizobium]|uniref:hypothetical protein n=1 Tax=unclassified Bradyrhizobium TaxID=2631580 RepID=UPI0012EBF3CD|nr:MULTISPECIES: hypothetical protein [unclassified Bradyrhizobium]MCP3464289.1 hypothetical protein [Bradyrhizobium sp. CCGUVB23]